MSVFLSPNLPANVVEIGNEISQAKINEINAGTLATQTWVSASYLTTASASSTYAPKASPTFTGTVTIPAGASISGYLTTASAASTYQTISGMSSYATQSYVTSQGYLTDAPSDGSQYARQNGAWAVVTGGGGGGGISEAPNDGYSYVRRMSAWISVGTNTYETVTTQEQVAAGYYPLTGNPSGFITSSGLSVTNIDLTGNFNGYSMGSGHYTFKFDSTANTLRMTDGNGKGTTLGIRGLSNDVTDISTSTTLDFNFTSTLNVPFNFYTISIPNDSTTDFPLGTKFFIASVAGSTIDGSMSGITLNGSFGGTFTLPLGVSILIKVAPNTWYIS